KNHLQSDIDEFISKGGLMIGICNGFQIMTQLGVLPGALTHNSGARYIDRWVDLKVENSKSPWLKGIKSVSLPIAHGEGRFIASKAELKKLNKDKQIAFRYVKGEMSKSMDLPYNPNGAIEDIAGVLAQDGRILGMMPHPERAMFTTQLPDFPLLKEKARRTKKAMPKYAAGLQIFKNGVEYFKSK
ncbi:MAG TPA: phosphoribosylformylglycinamidine synthase subunit PurQ, partial [Candidatus Paceibacterota bacterium]|nr:phosphoribosylformylglycinamidine synthase subunit PurQ [Candidatus Paceibacterota bacterium]